MSTNIANRSTKHSSRVPILMYHEVAALQDMASLEGRIQKSYVVSVEQFCQHLTVIRDLGMTVIGLDTLIAWQDGKADLPDRPVVISFDDGYLGNFIHAYPELCRIGATATFFVVSRKIGDPGMMTWEQLHTMAQAGMLVESHTASHPLLSLLGEVETRNELAESKGEIERHTGRSVTLISLPNGDVNPWYAALALELGYAGGCCSEVGLNVGNTDRYMLKRIPIKRSMTQAQLRGYLSGSAMTYGTARFHALAKGALVRALGKGNYDRIYNRVFGVQEQRKSAQ